MAYGKGMDRLSPCSNELICSRIAELCPEPNAILDVGCGRGERLLALGKSFPAAVMFGVDSDEEMVRASAAAGDIRIAYAEELPFADDSFDLVLCECSLSLFSQPEKALEEIERVLKKEGMLLVGEIFANIEELDFLEAPDGNAIGRIYSRESIELMACNAGFGLLDYSDRSGDLAFMAAQMIFDGSFCDCVGMETAMLLRSLKAGYGFWIFKKEEK